MKTNPPNPCSKLAHKFLLQPNMASNMEISTKRQRRIKPVFVAALLASLVVAPSVGFSQNLETSQTSNSTALFASKDSGYIENISDYNVASDLYNGNLKTNLFYWATNDIEMAIPPQKKTEGGVPFVEIAGKKDIATSLLCFFPIPDTGYSSVRITVSSYMLCSAEVATRELPAVQLNISDIDDRKFGKTTVTAMPDTCGFWRDVSLTTHISEITNAIEVSIDVNTDAVVKIKDISVAFE